MFCSELVAAVYQEVGLLGGPGNKDNKDGPPASEYVPRDFAGDPGCNVERSFIQATGLGPLTWIDRSDKNWCRQEEWCNLCGDFPCCDCSDSCYPCCCPCACYKEYLEDWCCPSKKTEILISNGDTADPDAAPDQKE